MKKSGRLKAESIFTTPQSQDKAYIKNKEKARRERDEKAERLKTLRLEKEAAEKQAKGK